MLIAVTGTPGTGKTAAADVLKAGGRDVESVAGLARRLKCSRKSKKGETEIDTDALSKKISKSTRSDLIVEGHLSHWLSPRLCIVLRCSPRTLERRLAGRRYSRAKVRENVEAEAVGVILVEAMENCEDVREIDTTRLTPAGVAAAIENVIGGRGARRLPGKVDWSREVMSWF